MKLRIVFIALTALGCGAVLGAEPPASPSATPIKHASLKACNKQADAKKLTGAARAKFVKGCQASKPS
jgi:hypothetical protein